MLVITSIKGIHNVGKGEALIMASRVSRRGEGPLMRAFSLGPLINAVKEKFR